MITRKLKKPLATTALVLAMALATVLPAAAQGRGLKLIRAAEMKSYLEFLAAPEFEGRPAPSPEVNIAALYVAREAGHIGLKPLLHDGSYLQYFPAEVLSLAPEKSRLRLIAGDRLDIFECPQSFCPGARNSAETGAVSGPLVFLGTLLSPPIDGWSGLHVPDVRGKIAVVIDAPLANPGRTLPGPGPLASARSQYLRERGAVGLVTIIRPDRESNLEKGGFGFGPAR